ncbi:MAG TPA: OmpA family protein, partial [Vicinamibacterales bacterium]|nr:OmpA family protein [Vicinamibacterales bacterium]
MSRMLRALSIGTLLVVAVSVPVSPAAAQQIPSHVRVITGSARILRWLRPANDVLLTVNQGTTLEVLDQDADWYWVVVPPNAHGTRKVGWIRASNVEPFVPPPVMPKEDPRREAEPQARVAPAASAASTTPAGADDKVTITERRDGTAAGDKKIYTFQDVHFDRNRYAILQQDMETLRAAVAALKADPSLVVDIEGYTCNLGTTKYNLELGVRRANAVKDYLVSEG